MRAWPLSPPPLPTAQCPRAALQFSSTATQATLRSSTQPLRHGHGTRPHVTPSVDSIVDTTTPPLPPREREAASRLGVGGRAVAPLRAEWHRQARPLPRRQPAHTTLRRLAQAALATAASAQRHVASYSWEISISKRQRPAAEYPSRRPRHRCVGRQRPELAPLRHGGWRRREAAWRMCTPGGRDGSRLLVTAVVGVYRRVVASACSALCTVQVRAHGSWRRLAEAASGHMNAYISAHARRWA